MTVCLRELRILQRNLINNSEGKKKKIKKKRRTLINDRWE